MANFEVYEQVDVCLAEHQYPVIICRNGLQNLNFLQTLVISSQVLIVTNQTIAALYLKQIQAAFAAIQCDVVILEDGEQHKNQQSLFAIYDALIQNKHHRDTTLIALGGGVVGDMAGFAASTYQRGVKFIQIPTTLLAQIDASIGGKTGINHPLGKNMIGSFYQPQAVVIDLATLNSLPEREFRAGIAEMIKYGLLAGGAFYKQLFAALQMGLTANNPQLPQLIATCCKIKAEFVQNDEKESGQRALLNLGHTFAHALEAYTHYQQWLHGEAVAIGIYCAAILSYKMKLINEQLVAQIEQILTSAGLPHKIPSTINLKKLIDLMRLDKKVKNNRLRFILIKNPGSCYLEARITEDSLYHALVAAVKGE
ncbi:3-dehydroquinate synthase [Legionella longbeachae]|uniref:3-dehydroquinate synthase n=1 Tax=Legionella longbeachae serogroup 1 (strain NSW150) TaxID=661367 RepID=D3HQQ5_LEGLN|nr:3-dehydroquinate synthase [Legionella longbeachae]VEE01741.1 3-dehydroquinate synthase [Legionella oakridgensis]HBD7396497.1 3-dehydroquinate synthase [Legionella pneumophila]ARB91925.1 3-dehydroquinate synthase [Legionella longbeachae]ARM34890.1 3-dehydroquinate synthase [Legionella longbeachae]EEZ95659.1 3-dehydroquinate synthase [Legionella longbeachae D-4968]